MPAIEHDKLLWETHVSDLKGWTSEGAKAYGINSIPTNYLIDGKGNILAKNLRGKALEDALEKYVKNGKQQFGQNDLLRAEE